tara:strand:- start:40 stop:690 length:651 start_codon:yes stop_codon:yes gene_type:complete
MKFNESVKPFPNLVITDYYDSEELELIWEELDFYTKPGKLFSARDFGGTLTNSHAIALDELYSAENGKFRNISNILTVGRKLFSSEVINTFSQIHDCCEIAKYANWDYTKVRYYHNNESYGPHTDHPFQFLAFSYFYREPKKFSGGELYFPKYNYELTCENNSIIIFPGWVEHGVKEVTIEGSDYYDGFGRYCISNFFGSKRSQADYSKDFNAITT